MLVGGTFAYSYYTGLVRSTKDLDIFVTADDVQAALTALDENGFTTSLPFPHWLAKAKTRGVSVDVIFSFGNGVAAVDAGWWRHGHQTTLFGMPVTVCPIEELIWSKAFIMERERYDGADVAHLIRSRGHVIDWPRLCARFGDHLLVLASHLLLFRFVYSDADRLIPAGLVDAVLAAAQPPSVTLDAPRVCWGTLLTRQQYLDDVLMLGYADARPLATTMTTADVEHWTRAIAAENASSDA